MATKIEEINNPASTLNKCADDEPIFILRAQDVLSVRLVNIWIQLADVIATFGKQFNLKTIPEEKVTGAIQIRNQMQNWQAVHHEQMKLPD